MGKLAKLSDIGQYKKQTTVFRGLNRTEGAQDGEFTDTENLACFHYPVMGTRKGRVPISTYDSPTDLFEWNGHLVVISNSILYYDGTALANVDAGQKQFAVVNTKLIIWPDQTYIDLSSGYYGSLDAETQMTITGMTASSITAQDTSNARDIQNSQTLAVNPTAGAQTIVYTYGKDTSAISWNAADGWTLPEPTIKGLESGTYPMIEEGDIIIPQAQNSAYSMVLGTEGSQIDTSGYNNAGYYGTYKSKKENYKTEYYSYNEYYVSWGGQSVSHGEQSATGRTGYYLSGSSIVLSGSTTTIVGGDGVGGGGTVYTGGGSSVTACTAYADSMGYQTGSVASRPVTGTTSVLSGYTPIFTLYRVAVDIPKLSELFVVGDRVSIYGCSNDANNVVNKEILSFDDATGTITFADGTFQEPFEPEGSALTIKKELPPLAFICSRGNRLYGVSNATTNRVYDQTTSKYVDFTSRCIYVSALGLPDRFWDFNGTDADSYQVAVSSNGDFTGICAMGDYTLCWKENELVQVYGDYPSNFGYNTLRINGVQAGSHRSMQIINEVLYYKGTDGIYTYALSTPQLISYNLGYRRYTDATAGSDGVHYHISMKDEDGTFDYYTYDTVHGLWMREDASEVKAFSLQGGLLHAVIGDSMYALETDSLSVGNDTYFAEPVDWYAVFPAFHESVLERKEYKRLLLRVYLMNGASIHVDTSFDGGTYKTVCTSQKPGFQTLVIPLPVNRVDRMIVRIGGSGVAQLHEMVREYIEGSDWS